jgi:hypothetical protein
MEVSGWTSTVSMPENTYRESLNRDLTQHERDVVRWLLEHGNPGAEKLIPQVDRLTVIAKCTCGCPTVDFALDGKPVPGKGHGLISDNLGEVDGMSVGVMLFATGEKIFMLEVYSTAGTDKTFGLPAVKDLFSWEELRNHPIKP